MKEIKYISYERGSFGYQLHLYAPTEKYPMYQLTCNDDEFGFEGTQVFHTEQEANAVIDRILHYAADAWMEVA